MTDATDDADQEIELSEDAENSEEIFVPIQGKVARILSNQKLVFNRGHEYGIEVGDIYAVLRSEPEAILDPDTDEVIGEVDIEKLRVKVVEVQEKISIATTFRKNTVGGINPTAGFGELFAPARVVTETLGTPSSQLPKVDKIVQVGDPVKEIIE